MAGASDGTNSLDFIDCFDFEDGFIKENQSRKRRMITENGKYEKGNNGDKTEDHMWCYKNTKFNN